MRGDKTENVVRPCLC